MTSEEKEHNLKGIESRKKKINCLLGFDFFINSELLNKNSTYEEIVEAWNKDQDHIAGLVNDVICNLGYIE